MVEHTRVPWFDRHRETCMRLGWRMAEAGVTTSVVNQRQSCVGGLDDGGSHFPKASRALLYPR